MQPQSVILGLSFGYVVLGLLLLIVLVRLALPRWLKLGAIVAISLCYILVFSTAENLLGWSAPVLVPEHFQLLWARVVEPNPAQANPGAIHLWLEALDDANLASGVPRAYLLPYSSQLASRVLDADAEIKKGHPQGGHRAQLLGYAPRTENGSTVARASASPGGDPSGGGLFDPAFLGGQSKSVELEPLPAPVLPEKDDPPPPAGTQP